MTDPLQIRPLTDTEKSPAVELDSAAFGVDYPEDYVEEVIGPLIAPGGLIGTFDPALAGEQVGVAGIYDRQMTFPGGQVHPVAAVSWVSVRPGQGGRGILTGMMRHQLTDLHDRSAAAVAILTASESGIYGRFGYAPAADRVRLEVPAGLTFRSGVVVEPVRQLPREAALPMVRELYDRAAATTTGHLNRSDAAWNYLYTDHSEHRGGASTLRFAFHPDGFVAYRIKSDWTDRGPDSTLTIHELCALSPVAHASLWRFVLDLPLVRTVTHRLARVGDPIRDLITEVRALRLPLTDHIWLRLVDLDRAIGQRGYRTPADVVVAVTDRFCPWNEASWQLTLGPAGGTATRTATAPQIRLDISHLATLFLGGGSLAQLVQAGRVIGAPPAIEALDTAMSAPLPPHCPEGF